jgi:hypothetical protein
MKSFLLAAVLVASAVALAQENAPKPNEELYTSAVIDPSGQLRILTTDGREILPPKDSSSFDSQGRLEVPAAAANRTPDDEQVGFESPAVSPDRKTVGWLALYPNCCTSDPIPLYLVLYSSGKVFRLNGQSRPVFHWVFLEGGKQVGFEQETVHSGWAVHYELHDARTGRLVAKFDPHVGADEQVDDNPSERPDWVKAVDAAK